ncbi:MAG: NAD(P)H-dependent oxidoreductase [Gammaproteobacteria bacterium]|nr:NAD(P)H-dependent oxidoreductase [Gammaproteobacteria bacterium]
MKITIISGSHRNPSQSMKVARFLRESWRAAYEDDDVGIFGLADNPLPLWDQRVWEGSAEWRALLDPLREDFRASDAFVIVSPEWHGQVPAGLKNLFLLFGAQEFGHKPALIVTVSAGEGGAYPVAELRMSSYKNNRICYLPEHLIIRRVESVLNENPGENNQESDSYYRARISWALGILREYARALGQVRASGATQSSTYQNGM